MLQKKQIPVIFLFEFKMGCKAVETTCNTNNTHSPGTTHDHVAHWCFKKFCKGDEPWRRGAQWLGIRSWQQPTESIIETDPLTTSGEGAEQLDIKHSTVVQHLKQSGKVKKLGECLMSWPNIKEIIVLKCRLLLFYATMNHFFIGLWHATKNGFYTTGDN